MAEVGLMFGKPLKRSPEQRRAERQQREHNPFKPEPKVKEKPKGLVARTTLGRNSTFGIGKGTLKRQKPGLRPLVKRDGQKFWVVAGKRRIEKGKRKALRYESKSPAAVEKRRLIRAAKAKAHAMWEGCGCIGSFLGPCSGPMEGMHAYSVGAHPEKNLSANPCNIFPGCVNHHRTGKKSFQFYAPWTKALQAAADLVLAAEANRRPLPSWEELQGEIARVIAKEEKRLNHQRYARAEEV